MIDTPMVSHSAALNGVVMLKWLVVPLMTCPTMTTISVPRNTAATVPAHHARRGRVLTCAMSQAQLTE